MKDMTQQECEYKPLLFTTTVRNPKRLKSLLWVFKKFDGQVLTDDVAVNVVRETMKYGLYRPTKFTTSIKAKYADSDRGCFSKYILTDEEVDYLVKNNPQKHKEAGFDYGYPSRFATIFDFAKELGFVYYTPNKKIEFSELGSKMAEVFGVEIGPSGEILAEEINPEYEQQAFLMAMSKYQRNNPFVRVLNNNVPLILLLQTIKKLNADPRFLTANGETKGISRKELPLLIFWKDNDADALYKRIKKLREKYHYNPSDEVIIDICKNEIMQGMKEFQDDSIMKEYPDEFIRKMRLTGLISLRGAGRFIDINHLEDKKVDYVLDNYSTYSHYTDEYEYFKYVSKIDENLISMETTVISSSQSETLLSNWVKIYNWQDIRKELQNLEKRKSSSDDVLKFIPQPARLEFLTALAIKSKLPNVRVIPNYSCDDTGLPTSTAGGNMGDIECHENRNGILVEVTMAEGRAQTMMEIWPIERHLGEFKKISDQESQCIFVAPSIFLDSVRQIDYVKATSGNIIRPYKISDFINYMEYCSTLYDTTAN